MTKETMMKLKKGDTVYVACKVDAVFIQGGFIQVSTRDCDNGFDAYEDEVLEPCKDAANRQDCINAVENTDCELWEEITDNLISLPPVTPTKEPILDNIRDEIDSAKMPKNRMTFFRDGIDCALQIIDKYRGESEEL